jgi:hypothetical protein
LGICHQLLSNLSLPPNIPPPAATPKAISVAPAQLHLLDDDQTSVDDEEKRRATPITLTLILACRSRARAEEAKDIILQKHARELAKRRQKGISVPAGWEEGLSVVFEGVDMDAVGGSNSILEFTERLKTRYVGLLWIIGKVLISNCFLDTHILLHSFSTRVWVSGLGTTTGSSLSRYSNGVRSKRCPSKLSVSNSLD